jgi:hypothetical protein
MRHAGARPIRRADDVFERMNGAAQQVTAAFGIEV